MWQHFQCAALFWLIGITGAAAQMRSPSEQEVLEAEYAREAATQRGDATAVDRLTGEEFVLIDSTGRVITRGERLGRTARKRLNDGYSDIQVKIYGDTALLTALRSWTWVDTAQKKKSRLMKVWVKRDGDWKVIATQYTDVAEK